MSNSVISLAYYVSRAKRAGATAEALKAGDFEEVLAAKVDFAAAASLWEEMDEREPLASLEDIDLGQADYCDIVDQIFRGTPFRKVEIYSRKEAPLPERRHDPYFPRYIKTLSGNDTRTQTAVEATMERLNETLKNGAVASPHANGLVVGRVQSGKTRNYVGLMLKAADEGWNVIIVLTSAISMLAGQTRDRIREEFGKVGADNPQRVTELDFLTSEPHNLRASEEALKGDYFCWGISMKQVDGLKRIRDWLEMPNQPLASMRVLIIDDESDNATPDSASTGRGNLTPDEIEARIRVIRRTEPTLADWFESLSDREWPESGEKTHEGELWDRLMQFLENTSRPAQVQEELVNSPEYRHFLGMDEFSSPPVENSINKFFYDVRGDGDNTSKAFSLLLRSILDVSRGRSRINGAICALVGPNPRTGNYTYGFGKCAYVGYTATPYANILNEGPSQTPLYADFMQSLELSPRYFGADQIFGHDMDSKPSTRTRMPIVNAITDAEALRILEWLRATGTLTGLDPDLVMHDDEGDLEWRSLKDALAWAFCTAAARKLYRSAMPEGEAKEKRSRRWTTMLVNVGHMQSFHAEVKAVLERYIARCCATASAREAFLGDCRRVWDAQTALFTRERFNELFNADEDPARNYGAIDDYPQWDAIRDGIESFLEERERAVRVVVLNSTPEGIESQELYAQVKGSMVLTHDVLWIVSGGNTISRGLTLEGLTATYFDRVRGGTSVDTLTQMGRWFGYRDGYELLPRLWMQSDAIVEMKRIALTERNLHESIADNFKQGFSPADPAHYQQITSWGRQLSGRARRATVLDSRIGTTGSAEDYYKDAARRGEIFRRCSDFVAALGAPVRRDPAEYTYAETPLWENVDRMKVRELLEELLPYQPPRSQNLLRGLVREISGCAAQDWDIVLGHPRTPAGEASFGGLTARYGAPSALPAGEDILRTSVVRLHLAFYAMIPAKYINREDVACLAQKRQRIAEALESKRIQAGGVLPDHYDKVLPGDASLPVQARLDRLIAQLQKADGALPVPGSIHERLDDVSKGLRNRSSAIYMSNVHHSANHVRPVLQMYLIRPEGDDPDAIPLVNFSFYWPDHVATGFFSVAVDDNQDIARPVTPGVFCQAVEDILRERNFPMQRKELLRRVLERLGARCNESFFSQHIKHPLQGFEYHKVPGANAYCIDGWAAEGAELQKLDAELAFAAITILQRDRVPYEAKALLEKVIDEQPRFTDFYVPGQPPDVSKFNGLLTEDVLATNGIKRSSKPIVYKAI
jgi:hypothetical protein